MLNWSNLFFVVAVLSTTLGCVFGFSLITPTDHFNFMMGMGTQEQVAMHFAFAGMGSAGLSLIFKK